MNAIKKPAAATAGSVSNRETNPFYCSTASADRKSRAMTTDEISAVVHSFNIHVDEVNRREQERPVLHAYGYHRGKLSFRGAILRVAGWNRWLHDGFGRNGFLRAPLPPEAVVEGRWDAGYLPSMETLV